MTREVGGQTATHTPLFFERYHAELGELFEVLEMPKVAAASLMAAHEATQPWVQGDHAFPEQNFEYITDSQSVALRALYERMDLKQAQPIPSGHYDEVLVLGAMQKANNLRTAFTHDALSSGSVTTPRVTFLGGERRISLAKEGPVVEQDLQAIDAAKTGDAWTKQLRPELAVSLWETDGLRLAATRQFGHLRPRAVRHYPGRSNNRYPHFYDFEWNDTQFRFLHSPAVAREKGQPRHTTESSLIDWVATNQPKENASVAFVGSNPGILRVGRVAEAALQAVGRQDIQLTIAGSAAGEYVPHNGYLREIACNLDVDVAVATAA